MEGCQHRECGWPETRYYFVEVRRPADVGIHKLHYCDQHELETQLKGLYIEEVKCDCSGFMHFFGDGFEMNGYGCPGPLPEIFNPCCGASDDLNVRKSCEYGCCVEEFCGRCGVSTHGGWGPVGCPCDKGWSNHWAYAERRMLRTPNGGEYNRRRKARVKKR